MSTLIKKRKNNKRGLLQHFHLPTNDSSTTAFLISGTRSQLGARLSKEQKTSRKKKKREKKGWIQTVLVFCLNWHKKSNSCSSTKKGWRDYNHLTFDGLNIWWPLEQFGQSAASKNNQMTNEFLINANNVKEDKIFKKNNALCWQENLGAMEKLTG